MLDVTLDVAVEMLKRSKTRSAPVALRELGEHPEDKQPVQIFEGRYGPYVKYGKINATIPKDLDPQQLTMEEALRLVQEKAEKGGGKRGGAKKSAGGAKKATKSAAGKKATTAKKAAGTKKAAKKKTPKKKTAT